MVDEQAALTEAERQGHPRQRRGTRAADLRDSRAAGKRPFIGEQRYEQLLGSQYPPITKSDFEENLRRSMMIEKLRSALTDWMAVSDADLEREYKVAQRKGEAAGSWRSPRTSSGTR
jgi:hypothetical protein